ncbi:MAG TPA: hypothetical protein VIK72_13420 [Clostridiaceae bacterium]
MALHIVENGDFKNDKDHFKQLYNMTYEEFIDTYSDDSEVIDLTGKIVVSLRADSENNLPMDLLTVFIPEEQRHNYKANLIYSGHIAFLKLEYKGGKVIYLYKDDECDPVDMNEFFDYENDVVFCCEEKGFETKDIELQIEKFIQGVYDYNFILDRYNVIVLVGL